MDFKEGNKSLFKEKVRSDWLFWRVLTSDININYTELKNMDIQELLEVNAALDIKIEQLEKQKAKNSPQKKLRK